MEIHIRCRRHSRFSSIASGGDRQQAADSYSRGILLVEPALCLESEHSGKFSGVILKGPLVHAMTQATGIVIAPVLSSSLRAARLAPRRPPALVFFEPLLAQADMSGGHLHQLVAIDKLECLLQGEP